MPSAERLLQREIMTRLRLAPLSAIVVPSPNGVFIPGRTPQERVLAKRIVGQLKADGQLLPGAPDLLFLWATGCACIELKRPTERDLLGVRRSAGTQSAEQKQFKQHCAAVGVPYVIAHSWPEVRDALVTWGCLPVSWGSA
jgi:hypothetical protein